MRGAFFALRRARLALVAVLAVILVCLAPHAVFAVPDVPTAKAEAISALRSMCSTEGAFGETVRFRDTQAAVEALAGIDGTLTSGAAAWAVGQDHVNYDFLARTCRIARVVGVEASATVLELLGGQAADGGWPLADGYLSDVWDTALAVQAIAGSEDASAATAARRGRDYLIGRQQDDGSWGLSEGDEGSLLLTAEAVRAIAAVPSESASADNARAASLALAAEWLRSRIGEHVDLASDTALGYLALSDAGASFDASAALVLATSSGGSVDAPAGVYERALRLQLLRVLDVDVCAASLSLSESRVLQGDPVEATLLVLNDGSRAVRSVVVRLFAGDPASGGYPLGADRTVESLSPGEARPVTWAIDTAGLPMSTEIFAVLDPVGLVAETDESDNSTSTLLQLQPLPGDPAILGPEDGSCLSTSMPLLAWVAPVDGFALDTVVQLDRSSDFDSPSLATFSVQCLSSMMTLPVPAPLADGQWFWRVRCTRAGASSSWTSPARFTIDTVAPGLALRSAAPSLIRPADKPFTVEYSLAEESSVSVSVVGEDGAVIHRAPSQLSEPGTHRAGWAGTGDSSSPVADGDYAVRVEARDAAGNATSCSATVTVDGSAPPQPTVASSDTSISPNGDGFKDTAAFAITASADTTSVIVRISDGSGVLIREDRVLPGSYVWNGRDVFGTPAVDGTATLRFIAVDAAGNRSTAEERSVLVKTACRVGNVQVEPSIVSPSGPATLTVAVGDDSTLSVVLNGQRFFPTDDDGDGLAVVALTAPPAEGNYTVSLEATDSLRNRRTASDAALVVASSEFTGGSLVWDSQTDFEPWYDYERQQWWQSEAASANASVQPGKVILDTGGWQQIAGLPGVVADHAIARGADGKLYVFGGNASPHGLNAGIYRDVRVYDAATDTWVTSGQAPSQRFGHVAVTAPDGKIYLFGGQYQWYTNTPEMLSTVESFDPVTGVWETDTEHGGSLAPMPTARAVFVAAVGADGKIYCIGGFTGWGPSEATTDVVEVYDPSNNTWETKRPLPQPRCCSAAGRIGDKIMVTEGERVVISPDGLWTQTIHNDTWLYDPASGVWETGTPSLAGRDQPLSAMGRDGRLYVYGSNVANLRFEPWTSSWHHADQLLTLHSDTQGVADTDGNIYALGGYQYIRYYDGASGSCERLDPRYHDAGTYTAPARDTYVYLKPTSAFGRITWEGDVPTGTQVTLSTRTSIDGVTWSEWSEEYVASGSRVTSPPGRYIQWRANLRTTDPFFTPSVDKVSIQVNHTPSCSSIMDVSSNTGAPQLKWYHGGWDMVMDVEKDPITYEICVDRSQSFDSAEARTFSDIRCDPAGYYQYFQIPTGRSLSDGIWRARIRARDPYSRSIWYGPTSIRIDTRSPIASLAASPSVFAAGAYADPSVSFDGSIVETGGAAHAVFSVYGPVESQPTIVRTIDGGTSTAATRSVTWDGFDARGNRAPEGSYEIRLDVTDDLGNRAKTAASSVTLRCAPSIQSGMSVRSSGSGEVTLTVPVQGQATGVTADVTGTAGALSPSRTGEFAGLLAVAPGTYPLHVAAADEFTGDSSSILATVDVSALVTGGEWRTRATDLPSITRSNMAVSGDFASIATQAWNVPTTSSVAPRYQTSSAVLNGKVYIVGGYSQLVEVFDPVAGRVSRAADFPITAHRVTLLPGDDGYLYALGGYYNSTLFCRYDPTADSWQTVGGLPSRTHNPQCFMHAGKIYVAGFYQDTPQSMFAYDLATHTWQAMASMPTDVVDGGAFFDGKRFYVFGGTVPGSYPVQVSNLVQVYDPATDTWTQGTPMNTPALGVTAGLSVDGRIVVVGRDWEPYSYALYSFGGCYDQTNGKWSSLPLPPTASCGAAKAVDDGALYWMGGHVGAAGNHWPIGTIQSYDTAARASAESTIFDAGLAVDWGTISWTAVELGNTTLAVDTRSSLDGQSWTAWQQAEALGHVPSPDGRYLQYRLRMTSTAFPFAPTLSDVVVSIETSAPVVTLTAPTPTAPLDGAAVFEDAPTFAWANSFGAAEPRYELQIDATSTFDSGALREYRGLPQMPEGSHLMIPASAPLTDGDWHWRVRALDGDQVGPWSAVQSVSVRTRPALASTISVPAEVSEGVPATCSITVTNTGAPTSDCLLRVYDGEAGAANQIGQDVRLGALGYGETTSAEIGFATYGRRGPHELRAVVSSDDGTAEATATLTVVENGISVVPHVSKAAYGASETVVATIDLNNASLVPREGLSLVAEVYDQAGFLVAPIGFEDLPLAGGSTATTSFEWGTGLTHSGSYLVKARVSSGDVVLAEGAQEFVIESAQAVDARLTLDHLSYGAHETVNVTSRVTNRTLNSELETVTVRTLVSDSDGATIESTETAIRSLMVDETRATGLAFDTGDLAPGVYAAREEVVLTTGTVAASSESTFAIVSSTDDGRGIGGDLMLDQPEVRPGDELQVGLSLYNEGNTDALDLPLAVMVVDPASARALAEASATTSIVRGADASSSIAFRVDPSWQTTDVVRPLLVVLRARFGGDWVTVASGHFSFAPIRLSLAQVLAESEVEALGSQSITVSLANETTGLPLPDARATVLVTGPDGSEVATLPVALGDIAPLASAEATVTWDSGTSAPGTYSVRTAASFRGIDATSAESTFTVLSTAETGAGLSGGLEAASSVLGGSALDATWTVENAGNADVAGLPVRLRVVDATTGSTVLETEESCDLPMGGSQGASWKIDTASLPGATSAIDPRTYLITMEVCPESGWRTIASEQLIVVPPSGQAAVSVDAEVYDCNATATVEATFTNTTPDFALPATLATITVTGPDGFEAFVQTPTISPLPSGESTTLVGVWPIGCAAPGTYTVDFSIECLGRTFRATSAFEVLSSAVSGTGISGSLSTLGQVDQGESLTATWTVTNAGNADLVGLPVHLTLVDAVTSETVASTSESLDVTRGAAATGAWPIDTGALPSTDATHTYRVLLTADVPARTLSLASAEFAVIAGTRLDVSTEPTAAAGPRVLVWVEEGDSANIALATRVLTAQGFCSHIATDHADFRAAMRSDLYNTFVILRPHFPMHSNLGQELAERVFAGDSVIAVGSAVEDDSYHDAQSWDARRAWDGMFCRGYEGIATEATRALTTAETTYTPALTTWVSAPIYRYTPYAGSVIGTAGDIPAVFAKRVGAGAAMSFAFDLSRCGEPDALLDRAIRGAAPARVRRGALSVLPMCVRVTNLGSAATVRIAVTSPDSPVLCAPAALEMTDLMALWEPQLPAGATRTLTALVRLPDSLTPIAFGTSTYTSVAGIWTLSSATTATVGATADRAAMAEAAITAVKALPVHTKTETQARQRILSDLIAVKCDRGRGRTGSEAAIVQLVDSARRLNEFDSDTAEARARLDDLVIYFEAAWSVER